MTAATQFGRRLRAVRKAHKMKIGQLAEKADTGVKHLGRIERGEKQPSFELIIALAGAMKVSHSTLFEFEVPDPNVNSLKLKLHHLLDGREIAEIQRAHRILKAILEP
jgi:transcriptional regulator with XRE-family HTH domain